MRVQTVDDCKTADDVRRIADKVRKFRQNQRLARGMSIRTEAAILPKIAEPPTNVIIAPIPVSNPNRVFQETPTADDILETVCAFYGTTIIDMKSARRSFDIARPRHIAMFLMKELTFLSYPQMGRKLGMRDHTTCQYGAKKVAARLKDNPRLQDEIDLLKIKIGEILTERNAPCAT